MVSLGDEIRAALPVLRSAAVSMMSDAANVYGLPVKTWVEATSSYEMVAPLVHTGQMKIRLADVEVRELDAQGQPLIVLPSTASFPVTADTVFSKDFTITVTASVTDAAMVGRTFRITAPHSQTYATARRYPVEEVI